MKKTEDVPSFAQSPQGFFLELVKIILIALAVILPVRYFLFQPFYVRGASMEPAFHDNEYLIIDEITYRFTDPQRGEVVVIRATTHTADFLIKRIIGLPGETLEMRSGQVYVFNKSYPDGLVLDEPYLEEGTQTSGGHKVTLGPDQYFVLGDNRNVSLDSRIFGALTKKQIVGRAWLRVWPFETFHHFTVPSYSIN